MAIRVCIDIGGTFTDLAVVNDADGQLNIFKTSTTPDDYARAVIEDLTMAAEFYGLSLEEFLIQCSSANGGAINYGTTIATNAIIQNKVAKVGLICTEGHRDILTLREGAKDDPYDWDMDFPDPYVPRYLTLPVRERMDAQGQVVTPLDEDQVREVIKQFKEFGVEVIAVSLLWSIANPAHEERIGQIIDQEWPGRPYILSHLLNPIIREYRRTISTVINASLLPVVGPYIQGFDQRLRELGYQGELSLISCFGGIMSIEDMMARPIYNLDSGPTGAPVAGLMYSRKEYGVDNVVTCDMGGTSFDVSRVTGGEIGATTEAKVGFDFLGIRKVDTKSIGAGGGSIAWVDSGGLLHVGPNSAGAQPGPACYQRGGDKPTTTDANLVLGYLNPYYLLGGRMNLDQDLARQVIERDVARPLKLDTLEAAFSIWNTVCVNMTDAIRTITSWEGIDPREYVFVSGGGAAGIHIIPMMADLGVKRLIIPKAAGVLSAVGGLAADIVAEFQRSLECDTANFDYQAVNQIMAELKAEAEAFLDFNQVPAQNRRLEYSVDARYYSQPWDLNIPVEREVFDGPQDLEKVRQTFHHIHDRVRGSRDEGQDLEFSNWRLKAVGQTKELVFSGSEANGKERSTQAAVQQRPAFFKDLGGMVETTIYNGDLLKAGNVIKPPAIIEEMATTIVVYPGSQITVSDLGSYLVDID
ncbi:MAG: hydantoinase/oxoprolinase family protein [Deltaproteobacteria bacterium]|nr:hydantoinase/oxoprolinase family protein [Deltaproteobacteria bacterium]